MHQYSAYCGRVQEPLATYIESVLDGKSDMPDFSLTVPVTNIDHHCIICGVPVETILLVSGREYYAEVFTDDKDKLRVDLMRLHLCTESRHYHDFAISADEEPDW